ncbi:hypothetical protein JCM18899A_55420 [Nocardioides sp. AN3]
MSSDQYFIEIPGDFVVRLVIETALAAFLLVWFLRLRRRGLWAVAGTAAALCWTAVAGFYIAAFISARRGALDLYSWATAHGAALEWVRLAGLGGVVLALTVARTLKAAPADA